MGIATDIRLAFRRLFASPGFTAVALLTLAIGLGATTAIFTVVRAVLIEGLPFEEPDRLVQLTGRMRQDDGVRGWPIGYLDLQALRDDGALIGPSAVTGLRSFNLTSDDVVDHVEGEMVSHDYFSILGVTTVLGRVFTAEEAAAATPARVAVIGHDLWTTQFGGQSSVLGRTIVLNDIAYEIVGVARPGFRGLNDDAQLWLPIGMAGVVYAPGYTETRPFRWLTGVARLRPGASLESAQQAVDRLTTHLAAEYPQDNGGFGIQLTPLQEAYFGGVRQPLAIVLAAAVFVLLIACSNVSNLLLARGLGRRREVAIRTALGAARGRVIRQFIIESVVLLLLGTAAGTFLATTGLRLIVAGGGLQLASFVDLGLHPQVVAFAFGLGLLSSLLAGGAPALLASRVAPIDAMKEGATSVTASRSRRSVQGAFLVLEVALALALLTAAGATVRGFSGFMRNDLGFDANRLISARLDFTGERFRDNERYWAVLRAVIDAARATPGIRSVTAEGPGMPTGGSYGLHFQVPGRDQQVMMNRHHVTPGYFETLSIPLRAGRDFTDSDQGAGTAIPIIVSEQLGEQLWPGENPLGRTLGLAGNADYTFTVIGVAGNARFAGRSLEPPVAPDVFLPAFQAPPRTPPIITVLARYDGDGDAAAAELRAALRRAAPDLPAFDVTPVDARLAAQTATPRLLIRLVSGFSLVALLLAALGVFGVVSFTVMSQQREVGIRLAIGASRGDVVRSVARTVIAPLLVGLGIGVAAAIGFGRYLESLLYGASPLQPLTLALAAAAMALAAGAALVGPVRRALRTDPRVMLTP